MKKIILTSVLIGASAQAQLGRSTPGALDDLKDARKQMEVQTENHILEKLEAVRLADEKNRRQQFESLNFSVVQDPATAPAAPPVTTTF